MKPSKNRKAELRNAYLAARPSDRAEMVGRIAHEYGVVPSTVRRWLGPLPRKKRADVGEDRVPVSDLAFGNMLDL